MESDLDTGIEFVLATKHGSATTRFLNRVWSIGRTVFAAIASFPSKTIDTAGQLKRHLQVWVFPPTIISTEKVKWVSGGRVLSGYRGKSENAGWYSDQDIFGDPHSTESLIRVVYVYRSQTFITFIENAPCKKGGIHRLICHDIKTCKNPPKCQPGSLYVEMGRRDISKEFEQYAESHNSRPKFLFHLALTEKPLDHPATFRVDKDGRCLGTYSSYQTRITLDDAQKGHPPVTERRRSFRR